MEGVHCDQHDCTIENVWWDDVCEDALSVKGGTVSSVTTVTGGGARSADDNVIQHNGLGTVKIDGFYGEDVSKLYRSCGTCGGEGRKATLSNIWVKSSGDKVKICQWSQGNANGEPSMLGDGPSPPLCQYSESDVHIDGHVSQSTETGNTASSGSTEQQSSGDEQTGASTSSSLRGSTQQDTSETAQTSAPITDSPKQEDDNNNAEQTDASSNSEKKKTTNDGSSKKESDGNNNEQSDDENTKQDDGDNAKQDDSGDKKKDSDNKKKDDDDN
ncbi:Pectate lyase [Phytophthora cinnamomi]|uniref:Pectate lyase n=1 Tax=Phytophthora cinnamomi TaxID=4785 RepID=UPI00355999EB|nr:Pectate lyase [Phytophthora cinnamomi]